MAFKIVTLCIRIFGQDEFKKYINAICDAGTRLLIAFSSILFDTQ